MKALQKIVFPKTSNNLQQNLEFGNLSEEADDALAQDSYIISKDDLSVVVENTLHTSGSSAIATRNITNYPWDQVYIPGNLIAVHCSGSFIAYALQAPNAKSGLVRIIHRLTEARGLVKEIEGLVKDLAFSHHLDQILLAFVDHFGTLFVHKIIEEANSLTAELKLKIPSCNKISQPSDYHRIIWCPYIPEDSTRESDEGDDENSAYLLVVVTNGPKAEIWHLASILEFKSGTLDRSEVIPGHLTIKEHSDSITDAAFSPDGTALATASLDGYVKFFQVYMFDEENNPRCLHQWKPHGGQPLSCLFFLDNHKNPNPEIQFWKYAITGACNNTELKLWSCETWHCHQSIKFEPSPNMEIAPSDQLYLKAVLDPSARYLLLSDIFRRVLYILIFNQESSQMCASLANGAHEASPSSNSKGELGDARFVSITELPIQYSAIFLTITDASFKFYKRWKHENAGLDLQSINDDADDQDDIIQGLVMKCLFINTKSFQEATIRFQPALPQSSATQDIPSNINISSSQDSVGIKDGLSDLSLSLGSSMSEVDPPPLPSKGSTPQIERDTSSTPPSALVKPGPLPDVPTDDSSSITCPSSMKAKSLNLITTPTSTSLDVVASLPISSVSSSLPSPPKKGPARHISSPMEASSVPQTASLNLLTPESFSSPRRLEDELSNENNEPLGKEPQPNIDDPLSKFWQKNPEPVDGPSKSNNILQDVISGSSKSPTIEILDNKEGPLATSELVESQARFTSPIDTLNEMQDAASPSAPTPTSHSTALGAVSSTSSPSLEVQSILHSNEDENDDNDSEGSSKAIDLVSLENGDTTLSTSATTCLVDLPEPPSASLLPSKTALEQNTKNPLDLLYQSMTSEKAVQDKAGNLTANSHPLTILSPTVSGTNFAPIPPIRSFSADSPHKPIEALIQLGTANTQVSLNLNGENKFKPLSNIILPPAKSHITCAQLEAKIKSVSPIKSNNGTGLVTIATSSAAASTLPTQTSFHPFVSTSSSFAIQDPFNLAEKSNVNTDQLSNQNQKILEELAVLKEVLLAQNDELEEKNQMLIEQNKTLSIQLDKALKNLKQVDDFVKSRPHQEPINPQALVTATKPAIEAIVRQEIKQALQPALSKYVETLRYQLNGEVRSFSDQISKTIHSRNFTENLSTAISASLSTSVQGSFRDIVNKTLLPAFSSVSQQIFSQMNDSFTKGTREYIQHVEKEVQNTKKSFNETTLSYTRTLEGASSTLTSQTNSIVSLVDNLNKVVTKQNTQLDGLEDRLRHNLREEISRTMESTRTSRAQTPVPKAPPTPANPKVQQQQIQQLISQGKINLAFKQALSASDLGIVVFVCERVNSQQLFNQSPCPLSQDVLLSLINQLSHDLGTFTDLKTKFLEEAILNLDKTHPVTMEHYQDVLLGFQRSLTSHLMLHPNHKKLNLLLMAVNHLVTGSGTASV